MFKLFFLAFLVASEAANEYQYKDCAHHETSRITIDGCAGITRASCAMQKGKPFKLEIDFTANQDTPKVEFKLTANLGGIEIPVPGVDTNGCNGVKCPLVKGQKYSFVFNFDVPKLLPNIKTVVGGQLTGDSGVLACVHIDGSVQD